MRLNKRLKNNREACDLRRYRAHYDVIVMGFHAHVGCFHFIKAVIIMWIGIYTGATIGQWQIEFISWVINRMINAISITSIFIVIVNNAY